MGVSKKLIYDSKHTAKSKPRVNPANASSTSKLRTRACKQTSSRVINSRRKNCQDKIAAPQNNNEAEWSAWRRMPQARAWCNQHPRVAWRQPKPKEPHVTPRGSPAYGTDEGMSPPSLCKLRLHCESHGLAKRSASVREPAATGRRLQCGQIGWLRSATNAGFGVLMDVLERCSRKTHRPRGHTETP